MPKSILAVLAGASVFAPQDQGVPEPIFDDAQFDPGGEQQPMLIRAQAGSATMTVYATEDLSRRGDVNVTETEYQFSLVVPVPYSADGWRPQGGFQGRSDLDATLLHAYTRAWQAHVDALEAYATKYNIGYVRTPIEQPFEDTILQVFRQGRFLA